MNGLVFGYGSLVNTATHDMGGEPASLRGWRRVWRPTPFRDAAFLSAEPHAQSTIMGLKAVVPEASWPALDQREHHYLRLDISDQIGAGAVIYSVPEENRTEGLKPIWLSYLDVVLQGFLHQFGSDGPRHFMDTTDGWENGIVDDRADPRYPRAQHLTADETRMIDAVIAPYRR
ncbi:MAG: gamma-glutamylcyclotransferase family protein [Pseudomonadota bacterium]